MKMRHIRKQKKKDANQQRPSIFKLDEDPMAYNFPEIEEYYIYNPKMSYPTGNMNATDGSQGIKIAKDAITYCTSGLVDRNKGTVLSYLHKVHQIYQST